MQVDSPGAYVAADAPVTAFTSLRVDEPANLFAERIKEALVCWTFDGRVDDETCQRAAGDGELSFPRGFAAGPHVAEARLVAVTGERLALARQAFEAVSGPVPYAARVVVEGVEREVVFRDGLDDLYEVVRDFCDRHNVAQRLACMDGVARELLGQVELAEGERLADAGKPEGPR